MKLNKLFAMLFIATAAMFTTSCSDDGDDLTWNSGNDAVVSLPSEYVTKETKGMINIPVYCTGDRNGLVKVNVEVEDYVAPGCEAAVEDTHYRMTSKYVNINPDNGEGYLELILVDDQIENETRTFKINITSVEHGTMGTPSTCIVKIKDNESDPYDRMAGAWTVHGYYYSSGSWVEEEWGIQMDTYDEGEEGYYEMLEFTSLDDGGYIDVTGYLLFDYDESTKKATADLYCGGYLGGTYGTYYDIYVYTVSGGYITTGTIDGEVSSDGNTITFGDEGAAVYLAAYTAGTSTYLGYWSYYIIDKIYR